MITEQLIWFIDSRFYYQTVTLDKIVHLANAHKQKIKVIIDVGKQSTGRGYWHLLDDPEALQKEVQASIDKKQTQLFKFFDMNAIKADIVINQNTDYLAAVNAEITSNNSSLVIIEDSFTAKRHSIFQHLHDIKAPILLLNNKTWKDPIKMLAAIDPLHEHAKAGKLDTQIIAFTQNWSERIQAKWIAAHCCYVDSVLTQYKQKVLQQHQASLNSFAKVHRIPQAQCTLLEGVPEDALAHHVKQQHINILIIGLVARNRLEQFWVGSTTNALLSSPPCDMLLIK